MSAQALALRVVPGLTRAFEADADGLGVLVFGPPVDADAEIVGDFWSD